MELSEMVGVLKKESLDAIISPSIMDLLATEIEMARKKRYTDQHHYKIYQGKDGRWFTRFPLPTGGSKQYAFASKEELLVFLIEYYKALEKSPTVRELFEEKELEKLGHGRITSATWQRNRFAFEKFFGDFGNRQIKDVTIDEISSFLERSVYKDGLNERDYKRMKGIIRTVLSSAVKHDLINFSYEDLNDHLEISPKELEPTVFEDDDEVYSEEDCRKLKDYLMGSDMPHDMALLLFLFSGLRNGEMSVLRWKDYDGLSITINQMERLEYDQNGVKHFVVIEGKAKTRKSRRRVPLTDGAKWVLNRMKEINPSGEFIFEDENGRRINSENLRKRLGIVCKNLGIKYRPPHKLRKTFLTILLDSGVSPTIVQDIAGHTSPQTTLKYYKMSRLTPEKIAQDYYSSIEELKI